VSVFCNQKPIHLALGGFARPILAALDLRRHLEYYSLALSVSKRLRGTKPSGLKKVQRGLRTMPEQLLTLEQVADYLNVDKFTVYRLIAARDLPAFKVGNQWRFKKKLIENWLERNSSFQGKRSH
jgi:excisionase family DNA binding protein